MRLLRVELRRLWYRRVTRGVCLIALVAVGFGVFSQWGTAQPPSDDQVAQAERWYAEELEYWEEHGEEQIAACQEEESADPAADADYECQDMGPRLENFLPQASTFVPDTAGQAGMMYGPETELDPEVAAIGASVWSGWTGLPALVMFASALLMLVFVAGVSFLTAEQGSGALGVWLTFEPRRQRVYWSKAVAAALGTVPVVVLGWAALVGGTYGVYAHFGTLGDLTGTVWADVAAFTGRLVLAGVAAATIGVALAVLLRHAAAAVGVAAAVLWVGSVFANSLGDLQRWTPALNLDAWLRGGATYEVVRQVAGADGVYQEQWVVHAVTTAQGGLYLLAVTAVLTLLALLVFRRRDVN